MTFSIGIFAAELSIDHIRQSLAQRSNDRCSFTFFAYISMPHLLTLYKEHASVFDGIIFSGPFPYRYILSHCGVQQVPCTYIDITHRDYYRTLLQVVYQNPRLNIRRIWIDCPTIDIPWGYIFGDDTAIPQLSPDYSTNYSIYEDDFCDKLLEKYLQVFHNHEADFIITRMTNLAPSLQEKGVPFASLFPAPASIWETVEKLLQLIQSQRVADCLSVVGIIQPAEGMSLERVTKLQTWLHQFNQEQAGVLIVRQMESVFEILTSNSALFNLTDSYRRCSLSDYLRANCEVPFYTGWGVGSNIIQAHQNAARALNESRRNKKGAAYLITESDRLIGPLGQEECSSISTKPGREARTLAEKIGISLTNAQKLLVMFQNQSDLHLTRNNLSLYLNTTVRTANRILTKLVEADAAKIVATEQNASAGRPISVYQLDLRKLYG